MADFKVQDSVQLLHGYTPTMTISALDEQRALCVWFDASKTRKIMQDWIPLTALKHTPEPVKIDLQNILSALP